jgi:hypothetical protein
VESTSLSIGLGSPVGRGAPIASRSPLAGLQRFCSLTDLEVNLRGRSTDRLGQTINSFVPAPCPPGMPTTGRAPRDHVTGQFLALAVGIDHRLVSSEGNCCPS